MKKRLQKLLAALLTLVMAAAVLTAFPVSAAESALDKQFDPIYGSTADAKRIAVGTPAELASLELPIGQTVYIELTADIDMKNVAFTPLNAGMSAITEYDSEKKNVVVLEGNGHTISNLTVNVTGTPGGLFMYLYNGSIVRNLHFKNCDVTVTSAWTKGAGVLAGDAGTQITVYNVSTDSACSASASNTFAGGLIGAMTNDKAAAPDENGTAFAYCVNHATVKGRIRVGGFVGSYQSMDPIAFRSCINKGTVTHVQDSTYSTNPGGFLGNTLAGYGNNGMTANVPHVFEDCVNMGTLTVDAHLSGKTYRTGGLIGDVGGDTKNCTLTFTRCYDASSRTQIASTGTVSHGAFIATIGGKSLTFTDCYATGTAYKATVANSTNTYAGVTLGANTGVAAKISAIESEASAADTLPVSMDTSAEGGRLFVRMKLTDPFGFMTITSLQKNGTTLAVSEYDRYVDDYGFLFLCTEAKVSELNLMMHGSRASGQAYTDGNRFFATLGDISAHELGKSVAFAAYVEIKGCLFVSQPRTLTITDTIQALSADTDNVPRREREVYGAMLDYHERYTDYLNLTAEPKSLTVSTYNIYHCADITKIDDSHDDTYWAFTDEIVNSDNMAEVILRNGIEICGMQETTAYVDIYGDGNTVQAERIANTLKQRTGDDYYWGFAPGKIGSYANDPDGAFGNAIVSKYPITDMECYGIGSREYNRCILIAELDVNGTPLTVLVSHFDNNVAAERTKAVAAVRELKGMITTPTVLMGDFNEAPGNVTGTYDALKALYTPTAKTDAEVPHTFPSIGPRTTYDYILHSPDLTSSDLYADRTALYSDHIPLIVTVHLPKK